MRCVITNKVQFTKTKAKKLVKEIENMDHSYKCNHCNKYHISSTSYKEMNERKKSKNKNS